MWGKVGAELLSRYKSVLQRRPNTVQSVQTAAMLAIGDIICQCAVEKHSLKDFDFPRLARFSLMGAALGPVIQTIYTNMERHLGSKVTPVNTLKKVAIDQLVCAPILLATFMTCVGLMEGRSWDEVKDKLKTSYFGILIANYKVWPLVQFVNFTLMPLNYRVLFLQGVAVGWNTFLSWKIHQDSAKKD